MKDDRTKTVDGDIDYRSGRRSITKREITPSKIKVGDKGIEAIVKPNK